MQGFLKNRWQDKLVFIDPALELDGFFDEEKMAIILSANAQNYERFLTLSEFCLLLKDLGLRPDLYSIIRAQFLCLKAISKNLVDEQKLLNSLLLLAKTFALKDLLEWVKASFLKTDKKAVFSKNNAKLNEINKALQEISDDRHKTLLVKAYEKFSKLSFSVAITGVMNAGKSSMLNALLKTKLLAVSNIPETANLTIIKYGELKARMYFWSKEEFDAIENKPHFSLNLDDFIKEEAFYKDIDINELKYYSSAKNEISFLIKKIELFTKLDFCKDGVSIVDTPGLDDVIYQRELISKSYIKNADFLIHLMNAAQPLAKKDLDFLIYSMNEARLSKFLIVLSRADLLSKDELQDAVLYCKKRLRQRLGELYLDEDLLDKVDFLSISSKKASDFYAGKASEGDLEASNIPKLERYLFNSLFSNEKSKLVLSSYKKELALNINEQLLSCKDELELLKKSLSVLGSDNEKLYLSLEAKAKQLVEVEKELLEIKLDDNKEFLKNAQILLAKRLKDRLIAELLYKESSKASLDLNRLDTIIELGFKDGINDILRDIKYRYFKQMQDIKERLSLKYDFLKADFDSGFEEFKAKIQALADELLKNPSFKEHKQSLKELLNSSKSQNVEESLNKLILQTLASFKLDELVDTLDFSKNFKEFLSTKLAAFKTNQEEAQNSLKASLKTLLGDEEARLKRQALLDEKIQKLFLLSKELDYAK